MVGAGGDPHPERLRDGRLRVGEPDPVEQDVPAEHGGTAGGIKQTVERIGAALGNAMVVGVFFGLVPLGWTTAFTGAYLAITLFVLAALVLAVVDERQHRAPVA